MDKQLNSETDFEIGDVEGFRYDKEEVFSHQSLVMSVMKRCLEFGAHELVEGIMETNIDNKGNIKQIYREDTRKRFVESIKCCKMIMICDFDNEATKNIEDLLNEIRERKKFWLDREKEWFDNSPSDFKKESVTQGYFYIESYFNNKLPFKDFFFEEEIEIWREIFEELNLLTKRLEFYKSMELEA